MSKHFVLILLFFISNHAFSQEPNYRTDEVIVRLNFKLLNWDVIDDQTIKTRSIKDLLSEEGQKYIPSLPEKGFNFEELTATKIFSYLKTSDSISISRQGKQVYVPPFWATFKVAVPDGVKFEQFGNDLKDLYPLVIYAHPNYTVETTAAPNDSFYVDQESINPYGALDHIMIDSAWSIETGRRWIKVGVFDTGIDSTHEDIELLTGKTYDGELFDSWGTSIPNDHGTKVAGIIGARRNNGIGIAGIAGGNGSDTSGVSLIDFKRSNVGPVVSIDNLSAGIIDASRSVGSYYDWSSLGSSSFYYSNAPGYGIHIGNHSYGYRIGDDSKNEDDSLNSSGVTLPGGFYAECDLCRESFLFSLQNGVVNVVARGNKLLQPGQVNPYSYQEPQNVFPASYDDSWVISVSASAPNGNRLVGGVNSTDNYFPLIGKEVDLVAPGSRDIVFTTHSLQSTYNNTDLYGAFTGTSSAAPHVSGVAALLLSYYNKNCYSNTNLDPADVEKILEKSATATQENIDSNGYNALSGHGRLNAYEALKLIELPKFQIIHPDTVSFSQQIIEQDTILFWLQSPLSVNYGGPLGSPFPLIPNRHYKAVKFKYQLEYDFGEYIQPSTQLLDVWVRHSQTNSLGNHLDTVTGITGYTYPGGVMTPTIELISDTFRVEPMCVIDTVTNDSIIRLTGYYYNFIGLYNLGLNAPPSTINEWYPIDPNFEQPKMAFSVYVYDDSLIQQYDFPCYADNPLIDSFANVLDINLNQRLHLYPNPGNGILSISVFGYDQGKIALIDASGRMLKEIWLSGDDSYTLNTSNLSSGIYFVSLLTNGVVQTSKKWIKQ